MSRLHARFKPLWALYRQDRARIGFTLLIGVVKHSPIFLAPVLTRNVFDALTHPAAMAWPAIWLNTGLLFLLFLQNIPTHTLFIKRLSQINRSMEARLRGDLITKLQQLSFSFHGEYESGKLHSKLLRDVESVQMLADQLVNNLYLAGVTTLISIGIILFTKPLVLLFFIVLVPISVVVLHFFRGKVNQRTQAFRIELEQMSARMSEMLEMLPVTRAHALEEREIGRMRAQLDNVCRNGIRLDAMNAMFGSTSWVFFNIAGLVCLVTMCALVLRGRLSIGEVVMYSGYFGVLIGSVNGILAIFPILTRGFDSLQSLGEILNSPDIERNEGKGGVDWVVGRFQFENVSFSYPRAERMALAEFTLDVTPGECIAFVGESGSGKSTLMNLVIGFVRPTLGRILLDGSDMNELDLRTYRKHLAVVSQSTVLFSGTIRENITYGLEHVSETEVRGAIEAANAAEFIDRLPEGLETRIGEHGGKLSGGQRQRLAIARALIRNPRVIIFDEATSALDSAAERQVREAMERLMTGRTTFIVAHRLSTIRHADRIVVLHHGHVSEIGNHSSLLGLNGEYARLVQLQQA